MPENKLNWSKLLSEVGKGLLVLALIGFVIFVLYSRFARNLENFEGIIVDKWINFSETQQGSYAYRVISVKTDKDTQIKINVDTETYERAQVGNRIKRDSNGITIINARQEVNK